MTKYETVYILEPSYDEVKAQEVADRLVAAGVSSILNFAPALITVPPSVSLRKVDLSIELQILSFYQQRRSGGHQPRPATAPASL